MKLRSLIYTLAFIIFAVPAFAFDPIELGEGKYLKIFYDGQFGLTYRDTGTGVDSDEGTMNLNFRRNRLGFIGTYNDVLSFYFQMEYIENKVINPLSVSQDGNNQNFYVLDAQLRYEPLSWLKFRLGKFKHNLTRENLEGCFEPLTLDRSLYIATPYQTSRDIGVAVWGNFAANYLQYRLDVMEGKSGRAGEEYATASSLRYTARLQLSLLEDKETGYGVAGTYRGNKTVLTIGGAVQYEPTVAYADVANQQDEKDYLAYSFDIFYEQPFGFGTVTASAGYVNMNFDDAYLGKNPSAGAMGQNGQKEGFYGKVGYMLPNLPLQFFARYDSFNFAALKSKNAWYYDQNITFIGAGANYYIDGQNIKVTFQYSNTSFDKEDANDPHYQDFNTIELYTQIRF
ncbi:MAG: porin [Deferribacterales bacterium]|nr:porin [Deferribacterales bacterium]